MTIDSLLTSDHRDSATPLGKAQRWSGMVLWSILLGVTLSCGGCEESAQPNAQEKNKKVEKKELDNWEIGPPRALVGAEPQEIVDPKTKEKTILSKPLVLKPGHLTATVQDMKANYDDFVGQLSMDLIDKRSRPARLLPTEFNLRLTRPVALAKGRPKRILSEFFVPQQTSGVKLQTNLLNRSTGSQAINPSILSLKKMPAYQYHLVVLAKEISRYGFLKVTDAVEAPWEEDFDESPAPHYRVLLVDSAKSLALPDNMLTWTSIAYVVWDEVDPTRISTDAQQALIDWLHWGGRLIVSGPDSLDALRGSFLDPYLPVQKDSAKKFTAEDLTSWSEYWSQRSGGKTLKTLEPIQPWSGIRLKPKKGARELAGGSGLFYEANVGRGTVVVSAIQLSERDFINWSGYDGFLNGALLRRPPRKFSEGTYGGLSMNWADYGQQRLDAHLTTGLRLFARDAATQANTTNANTAKANTGQVDQGLPRSAVWLSEDSVSIQVDRPGGLGAWNPFGPGANVARESLTAAAAVRIPGPGFVLASLAIYLIVLVPLNWMVFKSIGRLEWAWIAAPVIALLGTWGVVRLAQLDIGFVRSQTEIALLELQGSYPRGLLSRYTALYSSLSTTYDIDYGNPGAFAVPFPAKIEDQFKLGDNTWDAVLSRQGKTKLSGIAVSSASTRMVQSEEMFPCDGPLQLGESSRGHKQIENKTQYNLHDVIVVHRTFSKGGTPRLEGSWIGDLRAGRSAVLGLTPLSISREQLPYAEDRKLAARAAYREQLDISGLLRLTFQFPSSSDPQNASQEEYRAIGILDEVLPGTKVSPKSSQIQGTTVVLAHLHYGDPLPARPDINSRTDIIQKKVLQ